MSLLQQLWNDERGLVLSAEAVTVGTVTVLGATTAAGVLGTAVNEEFVDMARAIRSLDQSYSIQGIRGCRGWSAGSGYRQQDVEQSLDELTLHPVEPFPEDPVCPGVAVPELTESDESKTLDVL